MSPNPWNEGFLSHFRICQMHNFAYLLSPTMELQQVVRTWICKNGIRWMESGDIGAQRMWSFQQSVGISAIGALSTNGHPAQILGSLNEAQRAEVRANEMRKKISQLESSLAGHSTAGHVTITAPACHDGLGVILHDLTVTHVTDPLAKQAGWEVGDSILKVNGTTVLHSNQLSMELAKAMSASRAVGRPMIIDVWRTSATHPTQWELFAESISGSI